MTDEKRNAEYGEQQVHNDLPLLEKTANEGFGARPFRDTLQSIALSAVAPAVPQILREFNSNNAEIGTLVVTIEVCDVIQIFGMTLKRQIHG
ncbi:unnamed protein product [Aspergillus oryzae]|nr:unnamed protein product [Aspergillus oryzae]GMF92090.1 unnamed protein product [Aspergillus oryzae]